MRPWHGRWLPTIAAFIFAQKQQWSEAIAHAKASSDPALIKLITWQYISDSESGASFPEIKSFINKNPNWPDQKKLRIRAELALRQDTAPDNDIIAWFANEKPITGVGKMALVEAQRREKLATAETMNDMIRDAWRSGDFDETQEKTILETYGRILTETDHIARVDRLLWEEKTAPAKRDLSRVPNAYERMFKARIALITNSKLAAAESALVPSTLKSNPGFIYDRMRYRARKEDDNGVREMLLAAPPNPPHPEKWWRYREQQVRKYIAEHRFTDALKLLSHHGQTEGATLADALWLQGWIKCEFQDNPSAAYKDFSELYDKVKFPVSRARAAYWAGHAAWRSGDNNAANSWYARGASHATTFYGQLSAFKHNGETPLTFAPAPSISQQDKSDFEHNDVVRAIQLALKYDNDALANRILNLMIENNDNSTEIAQLATLGASHSYNYLSVRAAKKALQQNVVLIRTGYPTPATPKPIVIERALTLAITRQESEFDPHAKSPSNALGMMQLLPSTAKEVAKKNDIAFNITKLQDPNYNMILGSLYLKRLIDSYDGSYVLAIGAYNAGPGNVRKWMQSFGTPENDIDKSVNWIETVPFAETRNYIQRVLENLQVFRDIEGGSKYPLQLGNDLKR